MHVPFDSMHTVSAGEIDLLINTGPESHNYVTENKTDV